jgi:uncharacterized protein YlxW (UPF0749 family)
MGKFIQERKNIILLTVACVILGFILSRQFFLHNEVKRLSGPEEEQELSIQVARTIKNNKELTLERDKLAQQYELLQKASSDRKSAQQSLENSIDQYELILGYQSVKGAGVTIRFSDSLATTQITDLVNALRNMGVEAITINGRRIGPNMGWDQYTFSSPYKVQAIGDSKLLKESLERRGGIMEQIGFAGTVTTEKELHLPAIKK